MVNREKFKKLVEPLMKTEYGKHLTDIDYINENVCIKVTTDLKKFVEYRKDNNRRHSIDPSKIKE